MSLSFSPGHVPQNHFSPSASPLPSASRTVFTYALAGVLTMLQAVKVEAPAALASEPTESNEKIPSNEKIQIFLDNLRTSAGEKKAESEAAPEDPLAGAIEISRIPVGESVVERPIVVSRVRLRINVEKTAVRIIVEGTEFCSYESFISLKGSEVLRSEVGGARIRHPDLGTFCVDRGQLDLLARTLLKARTGKSTITIPITYQPETGVVSLEKRVRTVSKSLKQLFSSQPVPSPTNPTISFKLERLSPPLAVTKDGGRKE